MGASNRIIDFTVYRASPEDEPDDAPLQATGVAGQIQDLAFGGIEYLHNESDVGNAIYRYWSRRLQLPDTTMELLQCSEHPESLGPALIHLICQRAWELSDNVAVSQRIELIGRFMNPAVQTLNLSTMSPRTLTFTPITLIMGGDATFQNTAPDSAMLYANARTQELRTRLNGTGTSFDWYSAVRDAMGIADAFGG